MYPQVEEDKPVAWKVDDQLLLVQRRIPTAVGIYLQTGGQTVAAGEEVSSGGILLSCQLELLEVVCWVEWTSQLETWTTGLMIEWKKVNSGVYGR